MTENLIWNNNFKYKLKQQNIISIKFTNILLFKAILMEPVEELSDIYADDFHYVNELSDGEADQYEQLVNALSGVYLV